MTLLRIKFIKCRYVAKYEEHSSKMNVSKRYDIQKVLISGLLTTNRLAQDFIEEVNK